MSEQKAGKGKIIFWIVVIAILFLAALKNPSENEAKAEINTMLLEKLKENLREEVTNDDNNPLTQLGSGLAMLFAPTIIDNVVQTDVTDYIIFSTFSAKISFNEEEKELGSGIILFGKVIPL